MPQLQSPEIQAFANGFPIALMHIAVTVAILFVGVVIYVLMTPHREIALIREGNSAAALSLGGVLVGLAIPLSASLAGSTSALEIGMWGAACVALQLLIFRLVDLALHGLPQRIQEGEIAAAAWEWFQRIEGLGGMPAALDSGAVAERLATTWQARTEALDHRTDAVIGVSEQRELLDAGRAPGRPGVDDDDVAGVLGGG